MDNVVLVTGATGGIGRAIINRLVAEGYAVLAGDIAVNKRQNGKPDPLAPKGSTVALQHLDVTDTKSCEAAVKAALRLGRLKGLVNCAGIVRFTPVSELNEKGALEVWNVNVLGAHRMDCAATPHMKKGSAIVNISSVTSAIGRLKGASLYGASKNGLIAYTRYLAVELAPKGIRVNCLAPGYIAVPMSASMKAVSGGEKKLIEQVPLKRLGTVDEMADIVEFLLSDRAAYMTGAMLMADGGVTVA
ncbi:MAG: SDR family NAD(P)-dependent oxidoreductase [Alphaproteobacteria bacterium]